MNLSSLFKSALICGESRETYSDYCLFLFEVAFGFAKKGFNTYILTRPTDDVIVESEYYLKHPEVLKKIHYRYFKSSQEVIRWCHEAHYLNRKPSVILISLDHFGKGDDFEIISTCAALIDALKYFSRDEGTRKFYFLAILTIKFKSYLTLIHSFFQYSWVYMKCDYQTLLKPFFSEKHSHDQLTIHSPINFDDIEKLFHTKSAKHDHSR